MDFELSKLKSSIQKGAIVVFHCNRETSNLDASICKGFLSFEEYEHFQRIQSPSKRKIAIMARGTLKHVLSEFLGVSSCAVEIQRGFGNKPYISQQAEPSINFNVSHIDLGFVIALSSSLELGIDLEAICPYVNHIEISRQYFSTEEQAYIEGHQSPLSAFYECWTRREAFLKGIGTGIYFIEKWKDTSFLSSIIKDQSGRSWSIKNIMIADDHACAISYNDLQQSTPPIEVIAC